MMLSLRFESGIEEIEVGPVYDDDGVTVIAIATKPATYRRVYLNDSGVQVGPFATMADAFTWLRARNIPFDEAEAARIIASDATA